MRRGSTIHSPWWGRKWNYLYRKPSLVIHDVQPNHDRKYECQVITDLDPLSRFLVDQNRTTSSTLFVAWQPGFDGGLPQTFCLKYCDNNTQGHKDGCNNVTNLTGKTYNLTGLKPFTWYRLTLWAVNTAGNSSTVQAEASTAPLPPESYGINITLDTDKQILAFSNSTQSFAALCLIIRHTQPGEPCASVNKTECIEPGTNVTFQSENDPVVVTYGRGLCSEPAKQIDSPPGRQLYDGKSQHFMTITVGVAASAGVVLLVSVGLIFYRQLCGLKRKKVTVRSEGTSKTRTVRTGETSKSSSQQVSQGDYAEIGPKQEPKYEPLKPTKSAPSSYMAMKPFSSTHSTTLGCTPSNSGNSRDEYISPSLTGQEEEPIYASADDPKCINTASRVKGDMGEVHYANAEEITS